jgi:hypothetical protein
LKYRLLVGSVLGALVMSRLLVGFGAGVLVDRLWMKWPQERSTSSEQVAPSVLYEEILAMDGALFEQGFNNCELGVLEALLTEDFEFYHDQNGFQEKADFLSTFAESICSSPERKPIRKLTANSMEVIPLRNKGELYAAIQRGVTSSLSRSPAKACSGQT